MNQQVKDQPGTLKQRNFYPKNFLYLKKFLYLLKYNQCFNKNPFFNTCLKEPIFQSKNIYYIYPPKNNFQPKTKFLYLPEETTFDPKKKLIMLFYQKLFLYLLTYKEFLIFLQNKILIIFNKNSFPKQCSCLKNQFFIMKRFLVLTKEKRL